MVFAKYVTLVNIIFNKKIVNELIQKDFNKKNIQSNLELLVRKDFYFKQISYFKELKNKLSNSKKLPSELAAEHIEKIILNS